MTSKTENRIYIGAVLLILLITISVCCYSEGRVDEDLSEGREQQAEATHLMAERDYWYAKYDRLSHEADWLTVTEAEHNQGGAQ